MHTKPVVHYEIKIHGNNFVHLDLPDDNAAASASKALTGKEDQWHRSRPVNFEDQDATMSLLYCLEGLRASIIWKTKELKNLMDRACRTEKSIDDWERNHKTEATIDRHNLKADNSIILRRTNDLKELTLSYQRVRTFYIDMAICDEPLPERNDEWPSP